MVSFLRPQCYVRSLHLYLRSSYYSSDKLSQSHSDTATELATGNYIGKRQLIWLMVGNCPPILYSWVLAIGLFLRPQFYVHSLYLYLWYLCSSNSLSDNHFISQSESATESATGNWIGNRQPASYFTDVHVGPFIGKKVFISWKGNIDISNSSLG